MSSTHTDPQIFRGQVDMQNATAVTYKPGSINDDAIAAGAEIDADKLGHIHKVTTDFGVGTTTAPSADVYRTLFIASGDCTIRRVEAYMRDTGTSTDVSFDLYKVTAGTATLNSVLSATIDITHSDTDATPKAGTLSVTTLADGDALVAFMDFTSTTGGLGPAMYVEVDEEAN